MATELSNVPLNPGKWSNAADIINENSSKINTEFIKLENATTKFKGFFTSLSQLQAAWPSPIVGDTAWVGETYPGVVYRCNVAGAWLATTDVPPSNTVNISEYATQDAVSNEFASVRSDLNEIGSITENSLVSDFNIADENKNIIVEFNGGHIKTKNFDSKTARQDIDKANNDIELTNERIIPVQDSIDSDLEISDEDENIIVAFKDGHIKTKNFDSKAPSEVKLANTDESDFAIVDENQNIIQAIQSGYPVTKNFNGRSVTKKIELLTEKLYEKLEEWMETWSRMPKLEDNPLAKIRFDGGMARIFRNWGFIGDSLSSGEMYGRIVSRPTFTEITDSAITVDGIVSDNTSIITDSIIVTGYKPSVQLAFEENTLLSGKVLMASVSNGVYTPLIIGDASLTYSLEITTDSTIIISYPSANKPSVLFQNVYVKDNYDLSWGQQLARILGASGYNFSVGGEHCKRWCIGEDNQRRWQKAQTDLKDVYVIALSQNDRNYWMTGKVNFVDYPCVTSYPDQSQYGSLILSDNDVMLDIDLNNYENNLNSFAGWYAGVIQRIKSVRKDAPIFCVTNPNPNFSEWNQVIRIIITNINNYYGKKTIWLIDLAAYNPINLTMRANTDLNGHKSSFGYLYDAYQISTYIDWLIRNNISDFKGSSLVGTDAVVDDFDTFLID